MSKPFVYDPVEYWTANGPHLSPPGSDSPEQAAVRVELQLLIEELQEINGPISSVLDVGCGQGRLAAFLLDVLPAAKYSGLDLAEAQLKGTLAVRPDAEAFYLLRLQDANAIELLRQHDTVLHWDLVLASEVLLHIPPDEIELACRNLKRMAGRYLITVDWTQPLEGEIAPWNWLHDYDKLLEPDVEIQVFNQSIFLKRM
jgi:SAM-dependent methyltransferase